MLLQTLNDIIEYDPVIQEREPLVSERCLEMQINHTVSMNEIGTETEKFYQVKQILKNKIC